MKKSGDVGPAPDYLQKEQEQNPQLDENSMYDLEVDCVKRRYEELVKLYPFA